MVYSMSEFHEYCKDCPGPQFFDQEHKHMKERIKGVCIWKEKHTADHKELDQKFNSQKNWLISILTAVVLGLVGIAANFAILAIRVKP